MKSRLHLVWNLILGLFVLTQYAEGARATTLILGKSKSEPKIDQFATDDENATTASTTPPPPPSPASAVSQNDTALNSGANVTAAAGNVTKFTGVPQIDYIYDPNLPRELNGYNLTDYPFYNSVPEDIDFKCDGLHDGFYASVPHKCQLYHHCLFGTRYDFLCANYTAFDQKTFICHFASEVDCKNSPKYFHRNEALYKAATTTTTTTAAAPIAVGRKPQGNRRRRPWHRKRKPTYEYYDDYEDDHSRDYYDDEDEPPPPPPPAPKRKKRPRPNNNRDRYIEPEQSQRQQLDLEDKDVPPPPIAPGKSWHGDRSKGASKTRRPTSHSNNDQRGDKYAVSTDPHRASKVKESAAVHAEKEKSRFEVNLDSDADDDEGKDHGLSAARKPIEYVPNSSRESNHRYRGSQREKSRGSEQEINRPFKKRKQPSSFEQLDYDEEVESRPSKNRSKEGSRYRDSQEYLDKTSKTNIRDEQEGEEEEEEEEQSQDDDEQEDEDYYYYSRMRDHKKDGGQKAKINQVPHLTHREPAGFVSGDHDRGAEPVVHGVVTPYHKRNNQNYNREQQDVYSSEEDRKRDYATSDDSDDYDDAENGRRAEIEQSRRNSQQLSLGSIHEIEETRKRNKERNSGSVKNQQAAAKNFAKVREPLPRKHEKPKNREGVEKPSNFYKSSEDTGDYEDEVMLSEPRKEKHDGRQDDVPVAAVLVRPKIKSTGLVQRIPAGNKQLHSTDTQENDAPVAARRPGYITVDTTGGQSEQTNANNKHSDSSTKKSKGVAPTVDLEMPRDKHLPSSHQQQSSKEEIASQEQVGVDYYDEREREIENSRERNGSSQEDHYHGQEQRGATSHRLKVPLESWNDSEQLAPKAPPPSAASFPVSLRRRPFLPSRGGVIPRGLVPVGGVKLSNDRATSSAAKYKNENYTSRRAQQQQENAKPRDQDAVVQFRTKVSASIGVEQPQLTCFPGAAECESVIRRPIASTAHHFRETLTDKSGSLFSRHQQSEENHSAGSVHDLPHAIHNVPHRYRNDPHPTAASDVANAQVHFRNSAEYPNAPTAATDTSQTQDGKSKPDMSLKDSRVANRVRPADSVGDHPVASFLPPATRTDQADEPTLRLGPQTFYSENPKFKTTLVVSAGRPVAPPSVGQAATPPLSNAARCNHAWSQGCSTIRSVACNGGPCGVIRADQKSDSSRLSSASAAEANSRKTNSFSYQPRGQLVEFPKTDDENDETSNEYDESINDALQQFSTLVPRNVPSAPATAEVQLLLPDRGINSQPQGFKRRYHQETNRHSLLLAQQNGSTKTQQHHHHVVGGSARHPTTHAFEIKPEASSAIYRSYAIAGPGSLGQQPQRPRMFFTPS